MDTIDLKPRAIAVLCALRSGPKTSNQLGTAIGDGPTPAGRSATRDLLACMAQAIDQGAGGTLDALVAARDGRWSLTDAGLGWLQDEGLDATAEVKRALYGERAVHRG